MIRLLLCAAGILIGTLCACDRATAQTTRNRVVLAVDGIEQPRNLPVLIAERLGYFRDAGLTVTLVDAPADPSPAKLMHDGRADGAVAYFHHTFMSQTDDGLVTRAIAVLGLAPGERLMVAARLRGRVHSVADLKGMRIITGGPNSGKTTATTWAFLHAGLTVHDYTRLPLVPRAAAMKALTEGSADATMAHEPDASFYETNGVAFPLLDLTSPESTKAALGSHYPATSLYMPESFITAHPSEVRRLVAAMVRALKYIEVHDAAAIVAALPASTSQSDRNAYIRQIATDKLMFAGDGHMDPDAAAAELKAMAALNPLYSRVSLFQTWTNEFLPRSR